VSRTISAAVEILNKPFAALKPSMNVSNKETSCPVEILNKPFAALKHEEGSGGQLGDLGPVEILNKPFAALKR